MTIAIVTTGGTIDKDYFDALSEYKVVDSPLADLFKHFHVDFEFDLIPVFRKDSLEITDDDRQLILETVKNLDHEKVLITHGSDTMVETAKYLGDIPGKVVVLTGAMKPARFKDTDAIFNVGVAVGALQSLDKGIHIAMSGQVFNPQNVKKNRKKMRFESLDAKS